MMNLFKVMEGITEHLVAILTDDEGILQKIFYDGDGGPVIVTDDETLFEKIIELFG